MSRYYVTEDGQVFNLETGRCLKLHLRGDYLSIKLYDNGIAKRRYVHQLVAEQYLAKVEGKTFVNHKDGDKLNNCVSNLEWVTHKENCLHRNQVLGKSNGGHKGKKHNESN